MRINKIISAAVAGTAGLLLLATGASAATNPEGCSKAIDAEGLKTQAAVLKAFSSCYDAWRKDTLAQEKLQAAGKPLLPPSVKAAPACQKTIGLLFTKTLPSEFAKISGFAPSKCADSDLAALGHLMTAQFGTRWAQFVTLNALQSAYDQQIAMTRDFINAMQILSGAYADSMTGQFVSPPCTACKALVSAPCQEHACTYLTEGLSGASVNTIGGTVVIPVPLVGVTGLKICNTGSTNLIPGVTTLNEYIVFGETSNMLKAAPVAGLGLTGCVKGIAAEGYITCNAGGNLKVDYSSCQDHDAQGATNVTGATASGACTEQSVCLASSPDIGQAGTSLSKHNGVTNGGACVKLVPSATRLGDAFINSTSQISIVANSEVGPDGLFCTNDDTNASPGTPSTTSLTTGTVSSVIHDADNEALLDLATDPADGQPFTCGGAIQSSNLAGARIVGTFPALHALALGQTAYDAVTTTTISCN